MMSREETQFEGYVVRASLFGVGAPEALVIRVVTLLVFGPKGLGEVPRNLGKTLRDFQPTFKELQEVSREFKSTLEKAICLDEISSELRSTYCWIRKRKHPSGESYWTLIIQAPINCLTLLQTMAPPPKVNIEPEVDFLKSTSN
ncbi:hypothetical protein K2173_027088 [Erythroxylum novogranatense]|uniref:Uncharacterized protein n=1 Tax=Erythroxylum novogranatense TaxID=1862640 RepID=A0AAV8TY29_9ROSI|nr:hypothetical protein K2173_027088 [Erythroxylum novogranatense]